MITIREEERSRAVSVNGVELRILIAEDNADCAVSMATLLRIYGYDVEVAANGPTALEKARSYQPDVVLLDLALPGMNGYDVARQVSGHRPGKTPLLIAVTGFGQENDRRRSAEAGIDLHLLKPVDPDQLRAILERFRQLLAESGREGESGTCRL
jgi:two-component system OmpR family response regulator